MQLQVLYPDYVGMVYDFNRRSLGEGGYIHAKVSGNPPTLKLRRTRAANLLINMQTATSCRREDNDLY
jgi:hypothetical protein